MAGNSVTLEFAGDATKLQKAAKAATAATDDVGKAAKNAGVDMDKAGKAGVDYGEKIGNIGAGVAGMTDAVDSAGAAVQGLADIQDAGRQHAMKLARANADVEQAMLDGKQAAIDLEQATVDLTQAQADGRQSGLDLGQAQIDLTQAQLDAETAFKAYNAAVKEFGANSDEAKQAQIDLTQANQDENQALEDAEQARIDANQALVDGKQFANDATQAVRDGKDAQLNLNDAMKEANPSGLQQWADKIALVTPLLTAVVGVVGLVTAAQWAWNVAQLASPTTWIILAIAALIAIIVVIATKTDWFQRAWRASWGWIKDAASNTWDWLKKVPGWIGDAFAKVAGFISKPFRVAFNLVSDAWNNTVGRLSWTVPGWIPGIGGNSISVPHLPKFHTGGVVPGAPGTEVPIMAMAGEEVRWPGGGGSDVVHVTVRLDSDVLLEGLASAIGRRGRTVQHVLGGAYG
jgi:hypothetical protein